MCFLLLFFYFFLSSFVVTSLGVEERGLVVLLNVDWCVHRLCFTTILLGVSGGLQFLIVTLPGDPVLVFFDVFPYTLLIIESP